MYYLYLLIFVNSSLSINFKRSGNIKQRLSKLKSRLIFQYFLKKSEIFSLNDL